MVLLTTMKRNMVTIRQINDINPIENADRIERLTIGGWDVVSSKDNAFSVGDSVLFFEIDSLLSQEVPQFADCNARGMRTMQTENGTPMTGHVLRTMRLRGVYSQGLVIPLSAFGLTADMTQDEVDAFFEGKVVKWEFLSNDANIVGEFPHHIRKTDAERVQNLSDTFIAEQKVDEDMWSATEKVDGMSTTFWKDAEGEMHVAGRNVEITPSNRHVMVMRRLDIASRLEPGEMVQGELFGDGIQSNRLKLPTNTVEFRAFNATNMERFEDIAVPTLDVPFPATVAEAIEQSVKMKSIINPKVQAEGIVWARRDSKEFSELGSQSKFKSINPDYLAKEK